MVSNQFTELVNQLSIFGNEIKVKCSEDIRLTGTGELGSMDAVIKEDDILMYAIEEDTVLDLNFSMSYINMMVAFGRINRNKIWSVFSWPNTKPERWKLYLCF